MKPEHFRDEIISCLTSESIQVEGEDMNHKQKEAEKYLKHVFMEAEGNYDYPTYPKLMAVLKLLMTKEYKAGKNSKTVAGNFLKMTKKIKAVCSEQNP